MEKNKLIPRTNGIVSYKGNENEINIQNFSIGNRYAKAYGNGLKFLHAKKVNVSNNGLNDNSSSLIL
jgi:hypothetical protein